MPAEVVRAMDEASKPFAQLPHLQRKVGKPISELLGVPGARLTCGTASSITIATAPASLGPKPISSSVCRRVWMNHRDVRGIRK